MRQRPERAEQGGIADEDVELAEALMQVRPERIDLVEIAQVERDEGGRAADGLDGVVELLEAAHRPRHGDDVGTLLGKAPGDGGANAARGAGDESDAAGKTFHQKYP